MKLAGPMILLVIVCAPLRCVSLAQAPARPSPRSFAAFPTVQTRNIFDPQRYPNSMATERPRTSAARYVPPRASDFVALTGVMVTGDKALAFFGGSRPDYDKVLGINEDIAGAKLTKVTATNIEVERDGKTIVVAVGQTVPFDNSPPGAPPATFNAVAPAPAAAPAGEEGDAPAAAPPLPGNLTDVMRRMMERRQQQLK